MIINSITPYTTKINQAKKMPFGSIWLKSDRFKKENLKEKRSLFRQLLPPQKSQNILYIQQGQFFAIDSRQIFNRQTTNFFRDDLDWEEFINLLKEKFDKNNKVNTYIWGCSYGDEAFSLSMKLKRDLKEESAKFYPIHAKDISSNVINTIQERKNEDEIILNDLAKKSIKTNLKLKDDEEECFFKVNDKNKTKLNKDLTGDVEFSTGNIVTGINQMDGKNPSIVMCRNMWPYINPNQYSSCAKKMYDQLSEGSIIVIGNYDYFGEIGYLGSDNFPKELFKAGFKPLFGICCAQKDALNKDELKNYALIYEKV